MSHPSVEQDQAVRPTFAVRPVGYVESPYGAPADVLHSRDRWTEDVSTICLLPRYRRLLGGLEGYTHVLVVFWIHRAREWKMPKDHNKPRHVKVFATRMPVRPNPIGVSAVELLSFSTETGEMTVRGLDAVDGAPILDIKPYIPNFDSVPDAGVPQWVAEHLGSHHHGHGGHGHSHDHPHDGGHGTPPAKVHNSSGGPAQSPAPASGTESGADRKEG